VTNQLSTESGAARRTDKRPLVRVLMADDDLLVLEAIKDLLPRSRYQIVGEAANGSQAVELTERHRPDVVLLDVRMPVMDGIEAARRIRDRCPAPIVMVTASDDLAMVDLSGSVGVGAYVVKPPGGPELERAIAFARARFTDWQELRRLNAGLGEALARVKTLSGLLPICARCKRIRDDRGQWHEVEVYVRDHSSADFSHGFCPECFATAMRELEERATGQG